MVYYLGIGGGLNSKGSSSMNGEEVVRSCGIKIIIRGLKWDPNVELGRGERVRGYIAQ